MTNLDKMDVSDLEQVLAVSGQTLWVVSLDGTIRQVFGALDTDLGYMADELVGSPLRDLVEPADLREAARKFKSVARGESSGRSFQIELQVAGREGDRFDVKVNGIATSWGDEPVIFGLTSDITRQKDAERALEQERLKFYHAFEYAPSGIVLLHINRERGGLIKRVNAEACRMAGQEEDQLIGQWLMDGDLVELVESESIEDFELSRVMLDEDGDSFRLKRVLQRPDGSRIHIDAAVSALAGEEWKSLQEEWPANAIVHFEDVTDERRVARELEYHARHDALTDLFNRRHFISMLHDRLQSSGEGEGGGAMMMIDLDDFKAVNDSYGHMVGDEVLREVARIFKDDLSENDPVARLGGDEFAVLLPKADRDRAIEVAESLIRRFKKSRIEIPESRGEGFLPSVSIGVIMLNRRFAKPEAALRDCDKTLYEAKRLGGGRVVIEGGQRSGRSG